MIRLTRVGVHTRAYSHLAPGGKKPALNTVDPPNKTGRQAKTRIKQYLPIIQSALVPIVQMDRWQQQNLGRSAIELHQRCRETVELPFRYATLLDGMFECLTFIKTPHDDEPVYDRPMPSNRQSAGRCDERSHIEIDIWCKPTIELELGSACSLTPFQSGKVEIRKADRLP